MEKMGSILNRIDSPQDLQELSETELNTLCEEIRETILHTVSENGGHLASNLGVVELTVALHRVFHTVDDRILWDVGHQAYTHKLLTGRRDQIGSIRTKGGLSGFPNRQESCYDPFIAGHSSTSISAALGIANAKKLSHKPGSVAAVIGDGALTGGLAYEGLNNAGRFDRNLVVVLNDNNMSISNNVGSIARYLAHIRTKPGYLKMKGNLERIVKRIPVVGGPLFRGLSKTKTALKHLLYNTTLFEDMGFFYYGPFDGHNLGNLIDVFENARHIEHPVLIHVLTSKGKGYPFAEENPGEFHGIPRFDIKTGKPCSGGENFSSVFGNYLCSLAASDKSLCAITAAMQLGTGLEAFGAACPERFYDVGIAEGHAVTFAAGLAAEGMRPVFAVYSTFLQRGYDQIIHDAAIQKLNVTFAIDRAGVVGEDGETHQGIFDAAFLSAVPNMTVFSPCYYDELYSDLKNALYGLDGPCAIRYPRGCQMFKPFDFKSSGEPYDLYGDPHASIVIVTYGRLFSFACKAQAMLKSGGIRTRIVKLERICPIAEGAVAGALSASQVFFFEEGIERGGVGEHFALLLERRGFLGRYHLRGIRNFVKHAGMQECLADLGLDDKGMRNDILSECKHDREKEA